MPNDEWMPIDTAPKDGAEIIGVFVGDYGFQDKPTVYGPWTIAWYKTKWFSSWGGDRVIEREDYTGTDYKEPDMDPTHWMTMPNPPPSKPQKDISDE